MSSSEIEFQLEINDSESIPLSKILSDTYSDNRYTALYLPSMIDEANQVIDLQTYLKAQYLMLQHQQKRKNEKLKQIQYVYTNAFTNYLLSERKHANVNIVIANRSDLLQISESLFDELQLFQKKLFALQDLHTIFNIDTKPPTSFLINFHNFYPDWNKQISSIIDMEIKNSPKIENAFQSEYTFPSKVLASLKYCFNIGRFCQEMFAKPLEELLNFNQQLSLDFHHVYEIWLNKVKGQEAKYSELLKFLSLKPSSDFTLSKKLKAQLKQLMKIELNEAQKLIMEMNHFSLNRQAINSLFEEVGFDEIDEEQINIKMSLLVWKKILENRRKIQSVLTSFIDQILNSFHKFPHEVKHIIRQYYRLAKITFGEARYEDIKNFFNKVIYSQLLFPQFMRLLEEEEGVDTNIKNFNIPIIALLSQKILFGQQFYQKAKYSYFNQLITHYAPFIREFMNNFLEEIYEVKSFENKKYVQPALLSFETIKFLYDQMVESHKIQPLDAIESKICTQSQYNIGSSKFKRQNVYLILMNKKTINYHEVFKPNKKLKRILIQFLTTIDKIAQPTPLIVLLQQYKHASDRPDNASIQLYANYLSLKVDETDLRTISKEARKDIEEISVECQKIKIALEKQLNYSHNLQKTFMKFLKEKKKASSMKSIFNFIQCLMSTPTRFNYTVISGKVCEIQAEGTTPLIKKCLEDISDFYLKQVQGFDGLYQLLIDKIIEEVQGQGIVDEETILSSKNLIGRELYKILKLNKESSEKDKKIYAQMKKHNFVDLKVLQLQNYLDEEEIILELTLPLLKSLNEPHSADQLLKIFSEVTMVFQNIILTTGRAADITADLQIPMMIFILIRSKIKNLFSIINFIEKFSSEDINSTIMGQTLTLVKSTCMLIEEMNAKNLNLELERYEELCILQQEMMEGEADRQYRVSDMFEIS